MMQALHTPGHTRGHLSFYMPATKFLFSGDCLFALGCGRLFEGTPQDMFTALSRYADFDDDTLVLCCHEYTEANAK